MADVKWIKITTDMFDDEKIKIIEAMPDKDTILIIWIKLLTLAGKINANGYIYLTEKIPYSAETLATIFSRPLNTVRLALETFKNFGMVEIDDSNLLSISNWHKHQNVNGLAQIREQNRIRQLRHREKTKQIPSRDSNVMSRCDSNVIVTESALSLNLDLISSNVNKDITIEVDEAEVKPKSSPKPDAKHSYAEFVSLTNDEYTSLVADYGEPGTLRMIEILDNYKGANGKKYKSDYRAIKNWVIKRYEEEGTKQSKSRESTHQVIL